MARGRHPQTTQPTLRACLPSGSCEMAKSSGAFRMDSVACRGGLQGKGQGVLHTCLLWSTL